MPVRAGRLRRQQCPRCSSCLALTLGLISATDTMAAFAAGASQAGTHVINVDRASPAFAWIRASVELLRQRGARVIVLTLHWGPNMRLSPRRRFRAFAHAAIDCGVDVIHGHSAHIVQGVEIYKGRPILYDTGNFVDAYWKFPFLPDDVSCSCLICRSVGRSDYEWCQVASTPNHCASRPAATAARLTITSGDAALRLVPYSWNARMALRCRATLDLARPNGPGPDR